MIKLKGSLAISIFLLLLLFSCSSQNGIADGGTDFPNTKTIAGTIVDGDNKPVAGATMAAIPVGFNPTADLPLPASFTVVSDSAGRFKLEVPDSVTFNLHGHDPVTRTQLFFHGLASLGKYDWEVGNVSLKKTGAVQINVAKRLAGSCYVKGTSFTTQLKNGVALFDSLPAGSLPDICLNGNDSVIVDSVSVDSNVVTIIANVLLVVKYEYGCIDVYDQELLRKIESFGMHVTVVDHQAVTITDAEKVDCVLLSTTVDEDTLGIKFLYMPVPVITCEYYMQRYLAMTGPDYGIDYGYFDCEQNMLMTNLNHPVSAGFSDTVTIFTIPAHIDWGIPGPGADIVAVHSSTNQHATIYCYEPNALMVGMYAPAKRGAFMFWRQNTTAINDNGWQILRAMLSWAMQ